MDLPFRKNCADGSRACHCSRGILWSGSPTEPGRHHDHIASETTHQIVRATFPKLDAVEGVTVAESRRFPFPFVRAPITTNNRDRRAGSHRKSDFANTNKSSAHPSRRKRQTEGMDIIERAALRIPTFRPRTHLDRKQSPKPTTMPNERSSNRKSLFFVSAPIVRATTRAKESM